MRLRIGKRQSPQSIPTPKILDHFVTLPTGTCLKTENGFFYINKKNNKYIRYKIKTLRILDSWKFLYVVHSTEKAFARIPVGGLLGFRSGSVFKDISSGLFYMVEGSLKRKIEDPDYLISLGIDPDKVPLVSRDESELHKEGEVIK